MLGDHTEHIVDMMCYLCRRCLLLCRHQLLGSDRHLALAVSAAPAGVSVEAAECLRAAGQGRGLVSVGLSLPHGGDGAAQSRPAALQAGGEAARLLQLNQEILLADTRLLLNHQVGVLHLDKEIKLG